MSSDKPQPPKPFFPARTSSPLFHDLKGSLLTFMEGKVRVAAGENSHFWPDFEKLVTNPGKPLLRTAPVQLRSLGDHGHAVGGHTRAESQQILQKHAADLPQKLSDFMGDCIDQRVLETLSSNTKESVQAAIANHVRTYLADKEIVVAEMMRPAPPSLYPTL
jgi:hypothetical protein